MHIGIIYVLPPNSPDRLDPRLLKEVTSMGAAGIRVSVLCPWVHDDQPEIEQLTPEVTVYRKAVSVPSKLRRAWSSWTLIFPAWKSVIEEFIDDHGLEVLHVRDLPMLRTALSVAEGRGIPVVADFYENWPAAQESYRGDRSWLYQVMMTFSRGQFLYRWYERRCVHDCDRVVVVVPEATQRFVRAGFPQEKFVVVSNTEDETTLKVPKIESKSSEYEVFRDRWVAIYHGNVGAHRGLDTVVRGIPEIVKYVPNFLLLVLGVDGAWSIKLQKMARSLGVESHVTIHGWTPFKTCIRYVLASQVGLVPHNNFEHTQTTVPHKLFQYMLCGRPVVVSDCRPLERIVETAGAGAVFRANDSQDFARTIVRLAGDPEVCRRYGVNGRNAADTTFAWRNDAVRLVEMYREISNRHDWNFPNGLPPKAEDLGVLSVRCDSDTPH